MPEKAEQMVKTTINLPEDLWKAAKIRAMDERTDFRSVVIAALEAYLQTDVKPREGGKG
jgi:hypothetical protein